MTNVGEVLREWGARKLEERVRSWYANARDVEIDASTVIVRFGTIEEGYCETCYYSYEGVEITGTGDNGTRYHEEFSTTFSDALEELLDIEV